MPSSLPEEVHQDSTSLRRTLMLTQVHDWCLERLSTLSREDKMPMARALTAEHLELLEAINQQQTLWMVMDHSDAGKSNEL